MTALFTLQPEAVGTIDADSKQAILEQLAQRFAAVYGLNPVLVLERIEEREKLGRQDVAIRGLRLLTDPQALGQIYAIADSSLSRG